MRHQPGILILRGAPTPAEVAAVTAALAQAREQDTRRRPAWLEAARLEGVGGAPVASAPDLRRRG